MKSLIEILINIKRGKTICWL